MSKSTYNKPAIHPEKNHFLNISRMGDPGSCRLVTCPALMADRAVAILKTGSHHGTFKRGRIRADAEPEGWIWTTIRDDEISSPDIVFTPQAISRVSLKVHA